MEVIRGSLTRKNRPSLSCGCLKIELFKKRFTTHGLSDTRVYNLWHGILNRCYNVNCKSFVDYGNRGITVAKEWMDFENFFLDMGHPPDSASIERIDNNKGYSKSNCKWATRVEQNNNTRRSSFLTHANGRRQTYAQWAKELNVNPRLLQKRKSRGWSDEDTLTKPIRKRVRGECDYYKDITI